MTISTGLSGDLFGFINFVIGEKTLYVYMSVYILVSYIAVSFFMQIVKNFGAVTGVLAGTARKAMTLILSFILFPKQFSWYYVFGAFLVLGGLPASSLVKINKKQQKQHSVAIVNDAAKSSESEMLIRGDSKV